MDAVLETHALVANAATGEMRVGGNRLVQLMSLSLTSRVAEIGVNGP